MAKVFFSYSHDDEQYRDQLEKHLALLKREGFIESWHDRRIQAGSALAQEIDRQLERSDVVLLLVSASFLASDYCYGIEMQRAMERHEAGEATVIPVIVRPCDWKSAQFGNLLAVPRDGKAIVTWGNSDEAYTDVARQVRRIVEAKTVETTPAQMGQKVRTQPLGRAVSSSSLPRSSNMRLRKTFTDADKDSFLHQAFEHMARFFEGSLRELQERHPDIECRFRQIDANTFSGEIYRAGTRKAECSIHLGGSFRRGGITYSNNVSSRGNSFNEELSVDSDDQALFLKPMGMSFTGSKNSTLSVEQGAEFFWEMLITPLQ
jgi:hypothetical protein